MLHIILYVIHAVFNIIIGKGSDFQVPTYIVQRQRVNNELTYYMVLHYRTRNEIIFYGFVVVHLRIYTHTYTYLISRDRDCDPYRRIF